jgi:hypothetical protein
VQNAVLDSKISKALMQLLESGLGNERANLGRGLHGRMGARGLDGYYMVNVNPQFW